MKDSGAGVPARTRSVEVCLWCGWAILVEGLLYVFYRGHDARFHWLMHFLVGASTASALMALYVVRARRPVHLPLVWIAAGHLLAMAPDFAFAFGIAHQQWMDVFLGHVSSHFVPGRNVTWLGVFAVSLGAYLFALRRAHQPTAVSMK